MLYTNNIKTRKGEYMCENIDMTAIHPIGGGANYLV